MKVLFVVQGEGRGHLTQALSLRQKMTSQGHSVEAVLVGKSKARRIPSFFYEKMPAKIYEFESPNFLPTARNKKVNLWTSVGYNLFRTRTFWKSIRFINRMIQEKEVDMVVNFYELLTGMTYFFFRPKAPMVCVAHQYIFLHPDFKFPDVHPVSLFLLKGFTRLTALGSVKKLALSFYKMREYMPDGLFVVPPLLRDEITQANAQQGTHLLVYLLNSGYSEEVIRWHEKYPEVSVHCFWDKKGAAAETHVRDNLVFHTIDDEKFLRYLASASGYATTAGFESVCEAMCLGKPVLMVPTHIEQVCNGHDATLAGAGCISEQFDLDSLLTLTQKEYTHLGFRHWLRQADWLILREFREDLLLKEQPVSFWNRFITRQLYRIGKIGSV